MNSTNATSNILIFYLQIKYFYIKAIIFLIQKRDKNNAAILNQYCNLVHKIANLNYEFSQPRRIPLILNLKKTGSD